MIHYPGRPSTPAMMQSAIMGPVMVSQRRLENMNCIIEATSNMGGLFLGDIVSTLKGDLLRNHQIRAVLTCMAQRVSSTVVMPANKILPIRDTLDYPIYQFFEEATEWIENRRKQRANVLVHCHAGVSRSATIVVAYLMKYKGWNAGQGLQFVRARRERAKPNASFWNQLIQFENDLSIKKKSMISEEHSRKIQSPSQSKQNIDSKVKSSQSINLQEKDQIPKKQELADRHNNSFIINVPESEPRRRRKIFQQNNSQINSSRRQNVVSVNPSHHTQDLRRCSQSIIFPTPKPVMMNSNSNQMSEDVFRENRSAIDYNRVLSQQPVQSVQFHQQHHQIANSKSPQVHYLRPPGQSNNYVSPFELSNRKP